MTRISKGIMDAAWVVVALALAGCASVPEQAPEEQEGMPSAQTPSQAPTTAPATLPSAEAAPKITEQVQAPVENKATPVLNPDYPKRYTVQKGDSLWGLASRYLRDPWRWPELWQKNPQVKDPHRIFPGDVLTLIYVDGQPTLQVQRNPEIAAAPSKEAPAATENVPPPATVTVVGPTPAESMPEGVPANRAFPTVKLSPQVRSQDLYKAIPTIPADAVGQFLSRPRILTEEEIDKAPYIFSSVDEHLSAGAGNRVYVRGLKNAQTTDFVVVRKGQTYVNPEDSDDVLGYEAIHVGDAKLAREGDPATFDLIRTNREVLTGDRLLPADDGFTEQNYMPHPPRQFVDGSIIAVQDGVSQIGQYQVVVVDRGTEAGLDIGSVMAVYQASARVRDVIGHKTVKLPRERAATIMIFRVFDRLSYALLMEATRPVHVMDAVTNP